MLAPPAPRVIRVQPGSSGDGYDVEIVPPLEAGNFDAHFNDYKRARGYAGGLRLTLALPIVDLCAETSG
jgi:hypothetical protein